MVHIELAGPILIGGAFIEVDSIGVSATAYLIHIADTIIVIIETRTCAVIARFRINAVGR